MKNVFRLIGIIAIVTVIGFSIASCAEPEKDKDEEKEKEKYKYTATHFYMSNTDFDAIFNQTRNSEGNLTGPVTNATPAKIEAAYAKASQIEYKHTGLSYSEVEYYVRQALNGPTIDIALDDLKSKGVFIGPQNYDANTTGLKAFYRE